jgi:hypothetical protein
MESGQTKAELRKLSRDFRILASRLLNTDYKEGMKNLRRLLQFIENQVIIRDYIASQQTVKYDMVSIFEERRDYEPYPVPELLSEEVSFVIQLLKFGSENCNDYLGLAESYSTSSRIQDHVDAFNRIVVKPFVNHIEEHLHCLQGESDSDDRSKRVSITTNGYSIVNFAQDQARIDSTQLNFSSVGEEFVKLADQFIANLQKEKLDDNAKENIRDLVKTTSDQIRSGAPSKGMLRLTLKELAEFSTILQGSAAIAPYVEKMMPLLQRLLDVF